MEFLGADPGRKAILYFLAAILLGAFVLSLPLSHGARPVGVIDALFTATSAVCVTGLTVVDTGTAFSPFGQVVILVLIQLGGLGIMTFATLLIAAAGAQVAFRDRLGVAGSLAAGTFMRTKSLLQAVIGVTLTIELIGALVLFLLFSGSLPLGQAAWHAVFHSVSAFCNAGFSTFSANLEACADRPAILLTVAALIILGGLGFAVITELLHRASGQSRRLSLHTRICLSATAVLLVGGTLAVFFAEYGNTLAGFSPAGKAVNAFFQAVVCRTAGFNSVSQARLTEVAVLVSMVLMFIGACPGSTAGGIKTTTITVIVTTAWDRFRGRRTPSIFHRRIGEESIIRAVGVFILAVFVVAAMLALLAVLWDRPPLRAGSVHGWLAENLFEVVSAFGTVGLSLGITPELNMPGKIVIILTMFIGRVGLLTLAFGLARPTATGEIVYVEEPIAIG
ncbi:MAG TPA: TrkH family potassium uptake protein [candidate division Zixibacteria bacterium]|nr:hypothetical protein [candidate division Zixibacteria bacterium]MDD4916433.1 TrkH family potassium uptake protein [candidate division Zixibacteria bacterium]MDM7972572.1 TrkH family potassium uptake protein [candidate division Zixibacteria bacterium]HOD66423.1 TrkH family potassium uptake protein [candidate division Zixibacteria bacterium]HOZ08205.1 TrkH family potassium uptake protein [candidate division Zixibacteria bacterium]